MKEWKAPPCWICGRPKKGEWHFHADADHRYPLCWFCVGEANQRFCSFDHDKCGWWRDYTCTRQVTLEEMQRLKEEISRERAGGFKFVREARL